MDAKLVLNQVITTGKMTYEGLSRLAEFAVNACEAHAELQELCKDPASALIDPVMLVRGVAAKKNLNAAMDALLEETANAAGTVEFTTNTLKNIVEGISNAVSPKADDNGGARASAATPE